MLYIVWLGAAVNLLAGLHYTYCTVRAPTDGGAQPKPNPISWGIWSLAGWLAFFGQITEGVRGEAILTLCVAAVPTFIFIASTVSRHRYGAYAAISRADLTYGGTAIAALVAWRATGSGSIAVALSILCDVLVAVPVVRQAFNDPSSDSPSIWVAGAANGIITLITFQSFAFINAAFGVYFVGLCLLMSFLLVVRPRLLARRSTSSERQSDAAAAFAGAFAADYLTWDEDDPSRRAATLSTYIDSPADALWGWSGRGHQQADLVLLGSVDFSPDGYYVVDVRVRATTGPTPRQIQNGRFPIVVEHPASASSTHQAGLYAHHVDIPVPGSPSRGAVDTAVPEGGWFHLQVPVVPRGDRWVIPT